MSVSYTHLEIKPSKKLDSVEQRQLFSAVGHAKLINRYYELFREHGIPCLLYTSMVRVRRQNMQVNKVGNLLNQEMFVGRIWMEMM